MTTLVFDCVMDSSILCNSLFYVLWLSVKNYLQFFVQLSTTNFVVQLREMCCCVMFEKEG